MKRLKQFHLRTPQQARRIEDRDRGESSDEFDAKSRWSTPSPVVLIANGFRPTATVATTNDFANGLSEKKAEKREGEPHRFDSTSKSNDNNNNVSMNRSKKGTENSSEPVAYENTITTKTFGYKPIKQSTTNGVDEGQKTGRQSISYSDQLNLVKINGKNGDNGNKDTKTNGSSGTQNFVMKETNDAVRVLPLKQFESVQNDNEKGKRAAIAPKSAPPSRKFDGNSALSNGDSPLSHRYSAMPFRSNNARGNTSRNRFGSRLNSAISTPSLYVVDERAEPEERQEEKSRSGWPYERVVERKESAKPIPVFVSQNTPKFVRSNGNGSNGVSTLDRSALSDKTSSTDLHGQRPTQHLLGRRSLTPTSFFLRRTKTEFALPTPDSRAPNGGGSIFSRIFAAPTRRDSEPNVFQKVSAIEKQTPNGISLHQIPKEKNENGGRGRQYFEANNLPKERSEKIAANDSNIMDKTHSVRDRPDKFDPPMPQDTKISAPPVPPSPIPSMTSSISSFNSSSVRPKSPSLASIREGLRQTTKKVS